MTFRKDKSNVGFIQSFTDYFSGIHSQEGFVLDQRNRTLVEEYNDAVEELRTTTDRTKVSCRSLKEIFEDMDPALQKLVDKSKQTKIAVTQVGNSAIVGGNGFKLLKQQIALVGKEILLAGAQFAMFTLAITVITKLVEAGVDAFYKYSDSLIATKKRSEEMTAEYQSLTSELESLQTELDTTNERIDELQSKGSITLVEQDELKILLQTNYELTRQIALKKRAAETANSGATDAAYKTLLHYEKDGVISKTENEDGSITYGQAYRVDIADQIKAATEKYVEAKEALANVESEEDIKKYTEQLSAAEEEMNSLIDKANEQILGKDWSVASEEAQEFVDKINDVIDGSLLETGALSITEYLQASLGDTNFSKFEQKMQDLAEAGTTTPEEVQAAFAKSMPEVLDLMNKTGLGVDGLAEHINSLRNTGDVVSQVIGQNSDFSDVQSKIDEITSTDFDIDTSSVTEALGGDFIDALEDAGVSVSDLCTWLETLQEEFEDITIKDATAELAGIEESLNAVSDAYYEFVDNAGKVSASTLDGLGETFSGLADTKEFENFIKVLGNSNSTIEELNAAMDDLVDMYFLQQSALEPLTEEHKKLYVAQLQQMGVSNAEEVATQKIAIATIQALSAKEELTEAEQAQLKAAQDAIKAIDNEDSALLTLANSAMTAAEKEDLLLARQDAIAGSNFANVVASHASVLAIVAEAAGLSAEGVLEYAAAIETVAAIEKGIAEGRYINYAQSKAYSDAKATIENRQSMIDQLQGILIGGGTTANYTPVRTKEESGTKKTQADRNKEEYDKAKAILDNQLERNLISYNQYYSSLVKLGNKWLKGDAESMREHYAELADVRKSAYDHYQGILDKQLEDGLLSNLDYYKKSQALADKWLAGRKSNEQDLADAIDAIYDKILDKWDNVISEQEELFERWTIDKAWNPDKTEADYWLDKIDELDQDYQDGLFESTDDYLDKRYELLAKYQDALQDAWDSELDNIQESADSISELVDLVSDMMKQELEDQIDALEEQRDLYNEILDAKLASLQADKDAADYAKELAQLNEDLTELQAKAAVLALDDSREGKAQYAAVMEQIREKQEEIQTSQSDHTYDATTAALEDARTAYEEKIDKKVSDIESLMEEAGPWLERVYERIEQTPPSKLLSDLTKYNYYHGTGMDTDVQKIWAASEGLLEQFSSNIPKILEYLQSQESDLQGKIDGSEGTAGVSGDLSNEYTSNLTKAVQASATKGNTDAKNIELLARVREAYGSGWYDEDYKVIYMGEQGDRKVTAGAYDLINQMTSINNKSGLSQKQKKAQLEPLLENLRKKWSYGDAHLVWNSDKKKYNLYKTKGTSAKWQIFHSGLKQGFVQGDVYTPLSKDQREAYALLNAGELVLNRNDQEQLMIQLSVLSKLTDSIKKMQLENVPGDIGNIGAINVEVHAPITIEGSADAETLKQLEKFKKNLSNDVLGEVTSAMRKRGYSGNTAANARKK